MEGVKKIFDKNIFFIYIRGKKIFYWLSNIIYMVGEVVVCFWWCYYLVLFCVDNFLLGCWLLSFLVVW